MGSIPTAESPVDTTDDPTPTLGQSEVDSIVQSVQQAAELPVQVAATPQHEGGEEEEWASDYWDVSTMAPLNSASAVSSI